jgi:hypothetical protein
MIMKQLLFTLLVTAFTFSTFAQSEKYTMAMQKNIAELDAAAQQQKANFTEIANNFERIGEAEKTQWLPFYYAAYANVMNAFMVDDKTKTDAVADKAEALIKKAEELAGSENSETCVIKSMIASAHMMVDPMNRWQTYGQPSAMNIEKAKKMDPTNPRPIYLEGQSKFYTPENFGGGKTVAKPLFEKAIQMFDTFKPATAISPNWGKGAAQYFLSKCN